MYRDRIAGIDRHRSLGRDTETDRYTIEEDRHTDRHAYRYIRRQTDAGRQIQTDRQAGGTDRQHTGGDVRTDGRGGGTEAEI